MNPSFFRPLSVLAGIVLAFVAGATFTERPDDPAPSAMVSQEEAVREDFDWGTLYTYYQEETYGTKDVLTGVAVIKPGWRIHPPHRHAEEEYLMVTEGTGTWHLNGESIEAQAGDILYAAPWDVHGIKNTGETPLTFVVWKWSSKGVPQPTEPSE